MTHAENRSPVEYSSPTDGSGFGKYFALAAALLGWMFDGFEQGLFPLAGRNALAQLLKDPAALDRWFGVIMAVFLIGAAAGGVLFGWLGDRLGRVRAMSLSILAYALFTGLCAVATQAWHIAVLRFLASLGIGGEWALGVALVTEIWPDRSRAMVAGLIGASANIGFFMVGLLSLVLVQFIETARAALPAFGLSKAVTETLLEGDGWRLLMAAGALPALLTFLIRLFVPESKKWEREQQRGATSYWAARDLLGVLAGSLGAALVIYIWSPAGIVWPTASTFARVVALAGTTAGIAIALYGFLYPVLRYLSRAAGSAALSPSLGTPGEGRGGGVVEIQSITVATGPLPNPPPEYRGREKKVRNDSTLRRLLLGASLAGVALLATWGFVQWAVKWGQALANGAPHAKEYTQLALAGGAIVGTVLAAFAGDWVGRRVTYALLCLASFAACIFLFNFNTSYGPMFLFSVLLAGGTTAAFYGFFPLYLPELFPTAIRATAQGFTYNFGRVIAAIGTLQTAALTAYMGGSFPRAATALSFIYFLGVALIWFCPETKGKPLPD